MTIAVEGGSGVACVLALFRIRCDEQGMCSPCVQDLGSNVESFGRARFADKVPVHRFEREFEVEKAHIDWFSLNGLGKSL